MFFLSAGLLDYQAKLSGQVLYPLVAGKVPEWVIFAACYVWCYVFCGYFATAFVLLSFENCHLVYSSMYYILHIVLAVSIIICLIMPKQRSNKVGKDEQPIKSKSKAE